MSDLTEAEARVSVDRAKSSLEDAAAEVVRQIEGRAWHALGYLTWSDMREAEYGGAAFIVPREPRQELVARLRGLGMTKSEIAATAGVSKATVITDLKVNSDFREPETIQTSRGERPATYATQTPAPADAGEADAGAGQTSASPTPSPRGEAGTDSFDVAAVGASTSEGTSPAAGFDAEPATTAPRPQVSPIEAIVRDHEQNSVSAWRKRFSAEMARSGDLFRNVPADVAENAGHELLELLEQHIAWANDWHARVKRAQPNRLTVINGGTR